MERANGAATTTTTTTCFKDDPAGPTISGRSCHEVTQFHGPSGWRWALRMQDWGRVRERCADAMLLLEGGLIFQGLVRRFRGPAWVVLRVGPGCEIGTVDLWRGDQLLQVGKPFLYTRVAM